MSEAVTIQTISSTAVVLSAAITALLAVIVAKINRRVKIIHGDQVVIRDQLDNDHVQDPTKVSNLREDLDGKHSAVIEVMRGEFAELRRDVSADIGGLRSDLRITRREVASTNERIDETNKNVNRLRVRLEPRKEPE